MARDYVQNKLNLVQNPIEDLDDQFMDVKTDFKNPEAKRSVFFMIILVFLKICLGALY